jgi:hypothetical protein
VSILLYADSSTFSIEHNMIPSSSKSLHNDSKRKEKSNQEALKEDDSATISSGLPHFLIATNGVGIVLPPSQDTVGLESRHDAINSMNITMNIRSTSTLLFVPLLLHATLCFRITHYQPT